MKNILLKASIILLISGCVNAAKTVSNETASVESVNNGKAKREALTWVGNYEGVLPCADCGGIKTEISLNTDSSFLKKAVYLGKDSLTFEKRGTIEWDTDGKIIILDDSKYIIEGNDLCLLDSDGSRILGALSEHYILKRIIH